MFKLFIVIVTAMLLFGTVTIIRNLFLINKQGKQIRIHRIEMEKTKRGIEDIFSRMVADNKLDPKLRKMAHETLMKFLYLERQRIRDMRILYKN